MFHTKKVSRPFLPETKLFQERNAGIRSANDDDSGVNNDLKKVKKYYIESIVQYHDYTDSRISPYLSENMQEQGSGSVKILYSQVTVL